MVIAEISKDMRAGIRTGFVRDRLTKTSFAAGSSIGDLIFWESVAARVGPTGFATGVFFGHFEHAHTVECRCVRGELTHGTYTDREAHLARLQEPATEQRRQDNANAQERATQPRALPHVWTGVGGWP